VADPPQSVVSDYMNLSVRVCVHGLTLNLRMAIMEKATKFSRVKCSYVE